MKKYLIDKKGYYVIGIPKKWLKRNTVLESNYDTVDNKRKYFVDYQESDHEILISPSSEGAGISEVKGKYTKINADNIPKTIRRYIASLYRTGYNKIKITFSDKKIMKEIEDIKNTLLGVTIVEETEKSCVIKINISLEDIDFKNAIKRAFIVLLRIANNTYEGIKESNTAEIRKIVEYDKELNQQTNLCERTLIQKGFKELRKIPFHYYLASQIERIGDEYSKLCKEYLTGKRLLKEEIKILAETNKLIEKYLFNYTVFDPAKIEELDQEIRITLKKTKNQHIHSILNLLLMNITLIYTTNISEEGEKEELTEIKN
ncbi:phosphate uptake regulator PhoU [Candidatus Woesearchaeota archaeon]|nr:phosphate uptake regulator PhoU [Candidatus Woesearchaeota archaeon]